MTHSYNLHVLHLFRCVTSGLIMVAGDGIQQGIEYRGRVSDHAAAVAAAAHGTIAVPPAMPSFRDSYDVPRSFRSGLFGALAVGPIFHVWFRALDRLVPGSALKPVAYKMLLDQAVMAPIFTVFYFAAMGVLEGKSPAQIESKIRVATWPTLVANYCIFPVSQFANFYYVPQHLRVLVLNAGGLVYNVYLSKYNAAAADAEEEAARAAGQEDTRVATFDK